LGVVLNAVEKKHAYSQYYGHYGYSNDQKSTKSSLK